MTLRSRLLLSHGVVIVLAIVAFAAALYAIRDLSGRVDAIAADKMEALESTERMRGEFSNVIRAVLQRSLSDDASQAPQSLATATAALDGLHTAIENSRNFFLAPNEQVVFNEVAADYQRFAAAVIAWQEGKLSAAESSSRISNIFRELRTGVARLRELKSNELSDATAAAREFANSMFALLGALALLLLCVGIFAMLRLVRVVCFQVDDLSDAVTKMSNGEYDITCKQAAVQEFNLLGRHLENMGRQLNVLRDSNVERVMAEQRRTNAVLDSIDDGLVIFSDEGTIERINAVAERQLGAVVGQRFEDIGDTTTGRHIRQVLASGEYVDAGRPEIRIECAGEIRLLAYTLHRFVESQSHRIGVVMVVRDVTVQHEFDKMRSEFVLRASHELRTPIASIRMGLGLLGEKLDFAAGSRERELYQTVQDELTRMVGLLTDLLDLSRLRVGQQTLERAPTNIEEMLNAARQRFDPAATNANIGLTLEPVTQLPHVPLSRSGFDRVLDNLIANALRHTSSGGSVTLSAELTSRHLLIHVADTGEGITLAQQALIFEPFVQIGSKRGGAGLGLAICKEIVVQHGGEIRVQSQPRRGSTFTIALPI